MFGSPPAAIIQVQFKSITGHSCYGGVPGSRPQVRGLRSRFRIYSGRTTLLPRQEFQERAQTLQELQDEASRLFLGLGLYQNRNHDHLLTMRSGNHGALQADSRPAGILPGMLSKPESIPFGVGGCRKSLDFTLGRLPLFKSGLSTVFFSNLRPEAASARAGSGLDCRQSPSGWRRRSWATGFHARRTSLQSPTRCRPSRRCRPSPQEPAPATPYSRWWAPGPSRGRASEP